MTVSNSASGDAGVSSGQQPTAPPTKKKRNLPGMPDPDAEVIALSPKSLLATNRFVCEICNKGFQRDQNLQLHRRGHNLPWKLRQRTGKEVRKRVYVCPEPSCVHHDPSRALGDLTGIKKHFCRKHGEKKWKCEKCSKKYAVLSDWKAHSKTCGSREYRCDCGTLFSRRDSFITHRAFCDALAEETAMTQTAVASPATAVQREIKETKVALPVAFMYQRMKAAPPPELHEPLEKLAEVLQDMPPATASISLNSSNSSGSCISGSTTPTSVFAGIFPSSVSAATTQGTSLSGAMKPAGRGRNVVGAGAALEPPLLCLSSNASASLFPLPPEGRPPPSAHMSATALLQKAAQMGSVASSSSFLRGFGLVTSSSTTAAADLQWCNQHQKSLEPPESTLIPAGLGLGLPYEKGGGSAATAGLPELLMGSSSLFGSKPATVDFLGLGMGPTGAATAGGLSALITSISGGMEMCPAEAVGCYGGGSSPSGKVLSGADRKHCSHAIL
ncbi:Zinc finger protein MAGPIE [Apostasia shenzhenica]|uniref:Protein EARLY HEADING DATE 2 n=1 Tax=Apostasia shenzhenica TaxID=1088818 RepID=A0A2I0A2R9_9ASPA|nr:Zinc finger protein MAGPIE [Apostasia shenzhenica]